MASWHKQAKELRIANPEMTAAQIGSILGKSAGAVRVALNRIQDDDVIEVEGELQPPEGPQPSAKTFRVRQIDVMPLLQAAQKMAQDVMADTNQPVHLRAEVAVRILTGPLGKALAKQVEAAVMRDIAAQEGDAPEGSRDELPEYIEEIMVSMRRRIRGDG